MERKSYSVEWLSESSQRKERPSNVNSTNNPFGCYTLPFNRSHNVVPFAAKASSPDSQENCGSLNENRLAPPESPRNSQPKPCEPGTSCQPLHEVSRLRQVPEQEDESASDLESIQSHGSSCEDDMANRPRTKFTAEQLQELEKSFKEHRYIGANEKKRLSKVLKLSEIQIKTWFQNRRMKFKRQSQDARVEAFFSGLCVPYYGCSDLQPPQFPVRPEFALPIPPHASSLPFYPVQPVPVRPGYNPASIAAGTFGSYPYSASLMHPMLNEPTGQRFNPY